MAKPPKNRVQEFREVMGMSEEALAGAARIEVPQLRRIEKGVEAVSVLRATWIARALKLPLTTLFPTIELPLKRSKVNIDPNDPLAILTSREAVEAVTEGGLDTNSMQSVLSIRLRGGQTRLLEVAPGQSDHLWRALQDGDRFGFITFNASGRRYAINPRHLTFVQMLDEIDSDQRVPANDEYMMEIVFADNGKVMHIPIDPDLVSLGDTEDEDPDYLDVQIQDVFDILMHFTKDEIVTFQDKNEEPIFLRIEDVMLVSVPLECVEPHLLPELPSDDTGGAAA